MPHLSKKAVKKKIFKKISADLIDAIAAAHSKNEIKAVLNELLTPTEKIMLAKRLSILVMILKGYPLRTIEKTLKVSPSTIHRFWRASKERTYQIVVRKVKKDARREKFWERMEMLLDLPSMGKDRWGFLDKIYGKNKKS